MNFTIIKPAFVCGFFAFVKQSIFYIKFAITLNQHQNGKTGKNNRLNNDSNDGNLHLRYRYNRSNGI